MIFTVRKSFRPINWNKKAINNTPIPKMIAGTLTMMKRKIFNNNKI